jgi:hypothetical protein
MKDRLPTITFLASTIVLSIGYGIFAERGQWFPARQVTQAQATIADVSANWKNDLALEPTRHLVEGYHKSRPEGDDGYKLYEPDRVAPGYTLVSGLSEDQDTSAFSVTLYDEEGQPRHVWPVDYTKLDPDGLKPLNVMVHGMEVFPDGSIVVAFDAGNVIARLDACGAPMWIQRGGFHHSITRDDRGNLWAWRDNVITRLDENTGEVTKSLSLPDQILKAGSGQYGVFAVRSFAAGGDGPLTYAPDPFHANDVEPLLASMADAYPGFKEGDLLISLREINLVAVIDQDTGELRWWRHGPWLKQHDPDFQPDGTITVFDNGTGTNSSKIRRVRPATNEDELLFAGSADAPFSSWQRGKHQILGNGNVLVTETQHGRVFEAEPDGTLVWEREMVWDSDRNLIVTEARHVPADFFDQGIPACTAGSDPEG